MKYLFLTLASLIGLFQLIVFFQNLAGAEDATIFYLTEAAEMNPGLIMFFGFLLGGIGVFALILYFTGGKLPTTEGDFGGSTEEW
ncbi:MAG: hypothetical protein HY817_05210 [Candidatus Abawacabacteria bacterium]|nr:hypothetical protein [Candidatus Abawacabacteria bacterium]